MPSDNPLPSRKCGRRRRDGGRCTQWAMRGQTVCKMHGGKAPLALAKAEERMHALVHPAIASLQRQIEAGEFPATKYALDFYFRPTESETESDSPPMRITVVFDRADQDPETPPTLALNGHTPA